MEVAVYGYLSGNRGLSSSEYLQRVYIPGEKGEWLFLSWPGREPEAEQLLDWWQDSWAGGCEMLPRPKEKLFPKKERYWLALAVPQGAQRIPAARLRREEKLRLAIMLGRLHQKSAAWPAYLRTSPEAYWCRSLQEKLGELLLYRSIVRRRGCRTDFEGLFMENFDPCYRRGQEALNSLILAGDGEFAEVSKGWALWGASGQEVLWQEGQPLFYGLWPCPSLAMMDVSLLLKTLLWAEPKERAAELLPELLAAYELGGAPLSPADYRFLKVQWLFPESYWFHARRYFYRLEPPGKDEMEEYFHQFQAGILKEQRLCELLPGGEAPLAKAAAAQTMEGEAKGERAVDI